MTIFTTDRADSGEIPRPVGETRTRITAPGEATQELGQYLRGDVPFPHLRQIIDINDTVVYERPPTIGIVPDLGDAQPIAPWERIVDTEQLSILDSVVGLATPPATPPPLPTPPRPDSPGKYLLREGWPPERIDPPGVRDRLRHKGAHRPYRSPSVPRKRHPVRGLVWFVLAVAAVVAGLWPVFS